MGSKVEPDIAPFADTVFARVMSKDPGLVHDRFSDDKLIAMGLSVNQLTEWKPRLRPKDGRGIYVRAAVDSAAGTTDLERVSGMYAVKSDGGPSEGPADLELGA